MNPTLNRLLLVALALVALGCSSQKEAPPPAAAPAEEEPLPPPVYESDLPEDMRSLVDQPFTGDLDGLAQHRLIRVGVPFNRTFYFVDKGVQRGLSYEYLFLCQDVCNKKPKTGKLKIHSVPMPMPRDQLLPSLQAGKIDFVVPQLTITPQRQKLVDFSAPTRRNINEVVVTGPGEPPVASVE